MIDIIWVQLAGSHQCFKSYSVKMEQEGKGSETPVAPHPVHASRSKSALEDGDLKEKRLRVQRRLSNPEGEVRVLKNDWWMFCLFVFGFHFK